MKKTLASERIQDWSLLDLKPMHRALLRRMVDPPESNQEERTEDMIKLRWHQESFLASDDQKLLAMFRRPGVLIINRDALVRRVVEDLSYDPLLDALHHRCPDQIRLLWHWSLRGKQDLLWCTEMAFVGVISDPRSLILWNGICKRKGKVTEGQGNPLLSGIQLPTLAVPNSAIT